MLSQTRMRYPTLRNFIFTPGFVGALTVATSILIYNAIFFDRYFPVTEGWFSVYAHLVRNGLVPYRDFYLFLPPLYPLQIAIFQAIFGETFIALRVLGVVVMVTMSILLYRILRRRFLPLPASVAAITSIFYYQSGTAHIGYDFIQFFSLYVLTAIYLLTSYNAARVMEQPVRRFSRRDLVLFCAGIFIALAFLIKQSNGALVAVFSVFAVIFITFGQTAQRQVRDIGIYLAGMLLPIMLCAMWLVWDGAFGEFVDQVVFGAVASKGTASHILFSWLGGVVTEVYVIQLKTVLWSLWPLFALTLVGTIVVKRWPRLTAYRVSESVQIMVFFSLVVVVLGASFYGRPFRQWMADPGVTISQYVIVASTAIALLIVVLSIIQKLLRIEIVPSDITLIATVTVGLVWGNGTSAGIGEVSVFLGLSLVLGYLLSLPNTYGVSKLVVSLYCLSFILVLASAKFARPYAWWAIEEAGIKNANETADLPLMSGLRLPSDTANALVETTRLIEANSTANDRVFTFPNIPVFYLLANRWPHSKAIVSWFDFLPDGLAIAEAQRLLADPPAMIVELNLPEFVWTNHERLFRQGKEIGQRKIKSAIEALTIEQKRYSLKKDQYLPNNCRLKVWRRV